MRAAAVALMLSRRPARLACASCLKVETYVHIGCGSTPQNQRQNQGLQNPRICVHQFSSSESGTKSKMPAGVENVAVVDSPTKRQKMDVDPTVEGAVLNLKVEEPVLKYAKISPDAFPPERKSGLAAGFDLRSNQDTVVPAKGRALVKTDIKIALPNGCYGRIAPRSGLAFNKFIDVGAGVIDQDYRGEVKVLLFNFSTDDFPVSRGDRIAQLICERIYIPPLQACEDLDETERGQGGFGSTGTN